MRVQHHLHSFLCPPSAAYNEQENSRPAYERFQEDFLEYNASIIEYAETDFISKKERFSPPSLTACMEKTDYMDVKWQKSPHEEE